MKMLCLTVLIVLSFVSAAWAGIDLPAPKIDGGMGVFEALNLRSSARSGSFPSQKLDYEELSQILWAATGLNRDGKGGWTVPMARGLKPYCKIYVAIDSGVFLYDWENNKLEEVSNIDIRSKIVNQEYAKISPCSLIFVTDMVVLRGAYNDKELAYHFTSVAAGAMTQNVYLAAASMNLGARYIYGINRDFIHEELKLPEDDSVICIMLIGKYAL